MRKYMYLLTLILGLTIVGCKKNVSDMELKGNCDIISLSMTLGNATYPAIVERNIHRVTVRLPKDASSELLTVADLQLSEGATVNLKPGDQLNLSVARNLRVVNGNAIQDWTLRTVNDEARIYKFKLNGRFSGIIKEDAHTIRVSVPKGTNVKTLKPTAELSEYAEISPEMGHQTDFTDPVVYTIKNNTASATYTVTVDVVENPKALFVGSALSPDDLFPEEQAACDWMTANVDNCLYASWDDLKVGSINMDECEVIWWHLHAETGINSKEVFNETQSKALECKNLLQDFVEGGGALLLSRYATYLPAYLNLDNNMPTGLVPNNCWGNPEKDAEKTGNPWSFFNEGHSDHPIYKDILMGSNPYEVFTFDAGYYCTNSTAQWHLYEGDKERWGFEDEAAFEEATGAKILGQGGNKAVVIWEFPRTEFAGGVICIGSGAYDWYSPDKMGVGYHKNVETMTLNAINYLRAK